MPDPRLAALADALIPAAGDLPSASDADPSGKWLDRALTARPDLARAFERALEADDLEALAQADPEVFEALALVVSGAYYMNLKVRKRIGYPGQKSSPTYPDEADYYLAGDIVGPVVRRGQAYRPTPTEEVA
jgi:hypothetical protein